MEKLDVYALDSWGVNAVYKKAKPNTTYQTDLIAVKEGEAYTVDIYLGPYYGMHLNIAGKSHQVPAATLPLPSYFTLKGYKIYNMRYICLSKLIEKDKKSIQKYKKSIKYAKERIKALSTLKEKYPELFI